MSSSVALVDESHPKCDFILNSGSSIGKVISLPVNIDIGRREVRQTISDPTYGDILSKISSEHIKIHVDENGAISIEDLGSLNDLSSTETRLLVQSLPSSMKWMY